MPGARSARCCWSLIGKKGTTKSNKFERSIIYDVSQTQVFQLSHGSFTVCHASFPGSLVRGACWWRSAVGEAHDPDCHLANSPGGLRHWAHRNLHRRRYTAV